MSHCEEITLTQCAGRRHFRGGGGLREEGVQIIYHATKDNYETKPASPPFDQIKFDLYKCHIPHQKVNLRE